MDFRKLPYIPYRNYGYNISCNLLISFLTMYTETRVSNDYLSQKLSLSPRHVKRIIGDLIKDNIVIVEHPTARTRIMKLNLETIKKIDEGQFVQVEGQYVPDKGDNMTPMGDNMSHKGDNMSSMGDEMTPYNKPYKKLDEKLHSETHYKKFDNETVTTKSILNSILNDEKLGNNH
jgi:hypothetical protein